EEKIVANPGGMWGCGEAVDEFAEEIPGGGGVVAGLLAGNPGAFDLHVIDFGEGFLPCLGGVGGIKAADAGSVGEEVAEGDVLFAVGGEFGNDGGDGGFERDFAALDEHENCDGGDGFSGGEPEHEGVGGEGDISAVGGIGGETGVADG